MKHVSKSVIAFILLAILNLAACGFHLRGVQAPSDELSRIAVKVSYDSQRVSPFIAYTIKQQLENPVNEATHIAKLRLDRAVFSKRVLVLDREARPAEQLLILSVDYAIRLGEGELHSGTISAEKNYYFNSQVLSSVDQFEKVLQQQLLEQASGMLLTYIKRLAS